MEMGSIDDVGAGVRGSGRDSSGYSSQGRGSTGNSISKRKSDSEVCYIIKDFCMLYKSRSCGSALQ